MNKFSFLIRIFSLPLIFLCTSCEELAEGTSPFGDTASSDNIPNVTTINESIDGSSAEISWAGNEFALEFSYRLKYNLTDSTHMVNQTYFNWSDWTIDMEANFDKLDDGEYTFYVKSRFDLIEQETSTSLSFQINNISGPALRVYPLSQIAYSGDSINVYLYFEEVDASTINPVNLLQVDLRFTGSSGSNSIVELDGDVEDLSSSLHCTTENDPSLEFLTTSSESSANSFDLRIIQSYLDDQGVGLCNTGPLVRIPLKVLAADSLITIEILSGQYYYSENDTFQELEFNSQGGEVIIQELGQ